MESDFDRFRSGRLVAEREQTVARVEHPVVDQQQPVPRSERTIGESEQTVVQALHQMMRVSLTSQIAAKHSQH